MYPLQRRKSQNAVQAQWKKNPRWWKTQEIMILYTYNLINTQKVAIKSSIINNNYLTQYLNVKYFSCTLSYVNNVSKMVDELTKNSLHKILIKNILIKSILFNLMGAIYFLCVLEYEVVSLATS